VISEIYGQLVNHGPMIQGSEGTQKKVSRHRRPSGDERIK